MVDVPDLSRNSGALWDSELSFRSHLVEVLGLDCRIILLGTEPHMLEVLELSGISGTLQSSDFRSQTLIVEVGILFC